MVVAGEVVWRPTEEQRRTCNLARYLEWLATRRDLHFRDYQELWHWSVTDLEGFWASIWDYFEVGPPGAYDRVLAEDRMPGATWFPGTRAVVDRFRQLEPKVLLAADGYRYNGRAHNRLPEVAEIEQAMPSLAATVVVPYLDDLPDLGGLRHGRRWVELTSEAGELAFD